MQIESGIGQDIGHVKRRLAQRGAESSNNDLLGIGTSQDKTGNQNLISRLHKGAGRDVC